MKRLTIIGLQVVALLLSSACKSNYPKLADVSKREFPTTGITATLNGTDQDWHTWKLDVPINVLRFPLDPRTGGGRPSALNEVAIEINTQCSTVDWVVKVDWGALAIQSPLHRPILFVHGWRGDDTDFLLFEGYARGEGIPALREGVRLSRGLQPISDTVELLKPHLNDALQKFGVDKVNLFAHSKGGLVSRYLLRSPTENVKVENLFTFGSPHHGHDLVMFEADRGCRTFPTPAEVADCFASAAELRRDPIRADFNYNPLCQTNGTNVWYMITFVHRMFPTILSSVPHLFSISALSLRELSLVMLAHKQLRSLGTIRRHHFQQKTQ